MELWAKKVHLFFKRGAKMALASNWGTLDAWMIFVGENFDHGLGKWTVEPRNNYD